jgi:hypothetical protein
VSNVFPKGVIFIPFPSAVAEILGDLTEAEVRLYTALLLFAQKHTATKLHLPAFLLHDYTKLHAETIAVARRKLERRNLISCTSGGSGVTVYELMNPVTYEELPTPIIGKRKFSGVYVHKGDGRSSRTTRKTPKVVASPPVIPPTWEQLNELKPIQSVSMTEPIRDSVTDRLVSCFSQVHEKEKVNKLQSSISEIPISKEVLNREFSSKVGETPAAKLPVEPWVDPGFGVPYVDWVRGEVAKQLGPGMPFWLKRKAVNASY